jgi:hypothetical protein
MRKILLLPFCLLLASIAFAQQADDVQNQFSNSADNILSSNSKLVVGGYGEVHYNQPFDSDIRSNGNLDVHRIVMLLGYNFNSQTQFVTELEFEHVSEVVVEQAFLQHKLNNYLQFRGGLMLVPMGIINEYHEPNTFNGVERPLIDNLIAPTTWREIGVGVTGNILPASMKYQAYLMNGFNGYDGSARLGGKNGLRKGRQKGAESFMSSPNFTGKVEYYGVRGLNVGLSGYFGNTQSTLYNGIDKNNASALAKADSSVVGVSMLGADARYNIQGLQLRGQLYYTSLSNSDQYNAFTSSDLGSSMIGWYVEVGYNVLRTMQTDKQLVPFVRYEFLDTHNSVEGSLQKKASYEKNVLSTGLTFALTKGAVVKGDVQFLKSGGDASYAKTLNLGIGVMF